MHLDEPFFSRMIKQSELARQWGLSRNMINKLVKRGMPLTSAEEAAEWREANARRRTASRRIQEASEAPVEPKTPKRKGRPPKEKPEDVTIEGTVMAAVAAQIKASRLLDDAMRDGKPSMIAPLLSIHSKAIEARFSAERALREEKQQRNLLVPFQDAHALFKRGWDLVLGRLKRLPQAKCTECNPANPRMAFDALEKAINQIIADAQREYAA
jgi:hypothetical protein